MVWETSVNFLMKRQILSVRIRLYAEWPEVGMRFEDAELAGVL